MDNSELNQARIFNIAAGEMLPLIESMRDDAYEAMLSQFNAGEKDLLVPIAKLHALQTLIDDIKTKIDLFNHAATKEQAQ